MPQSDDPSDGSSPFTDSIATDQNSPGDLDSLFACLANHRRRLLLEGISKTSGPVVVEELVQHIVEREDVATADTDSSDQLVEITISLFHNHLPKMREAGVIDVDHETNTVQEGNRFETAKSLLEIV